MLASFQSRARPVSGSHPPNSKSSIAKHVVRNCIGALAVLVCAASTARAQAGTTISGRVTNEQGVPLPGATVLIQGTTTGAHTDDAGRYTIIVPASAANGQTANLIGRVIGYAARTVPIVTRFWLAKIAVGGSGRPRRSAAAASARSLSCRSCRTISGSIGIPASRSAAS